MKKYTVVFGGTFNPLHIGHYEMIAALNEMPQIEKILVMPSFIPPHKEYVAVVSDEDRKNMCEIAARDFSKAEVCLDEFRRRGKSYTFDTITLLKQKCPQTNFALACGGDMITSMDTWYRWQELIRLVRIFAFRRANEEGFEEAIDMLQNSGADIEIVNSQITDISSSQLRNLLKKDTLNKYLPPKIADYIRERKLYCE